MYIVKKELPHDRKLRQIRNRNKVTQPGKREITQVEKQRKALVKRMVAKIKLAFRPQGR